MGMALSVYTVAVERQLLSRAEAIERTLTLLRFFRFRAIKDANPMPRDTKGSTIISSTWRLAVELWSRELSTIPILPSWSLGRLPQQITLPEIPKPSSEIRDLADILYRRTSIGNGHWMVEKQFATDGNRIRDLLPFRWDAGYSEALILYALALGSPTFPIDAGGYREWTSTFEWKKFYDIEYLYAGPLYIHQMSHLWLDFRGIGDDFNRKVGIDYFENSRRATYVQQQYGIENPLGFSHYHKYGWGLTASDGPGPAVLEIKGIRREFFDYTARGAPLGPDDGTISPWAVVASLPFAPEIVIDTIRHAIERLKLKGHSPYGFDASYNETYPDTTRNQHGWVSPWIFGLNQGPIILMIENFQSELIWKTIRKCGYIVEGLRRAGFRGGWLGGSKL